MGAISNKVKRRLLKQKRQSRRAGGFPPEEMPEDVHTPEQLVREGYDPIHAAYVAAQNFTSFFAEGVSVWPELDPYYRIAAKAQDEYMPSGPPWSPLSRSYFTSWAFFDLRFGPDKETIGSILLDVADLFDMVPLLEEAVRNYSESRMGIYEVAGKLAGQVLLRELLTNKQFPCLITSGYSAKPGELLYMRRCPPLADLGSHHVGVTSPYVLIDFTEKDWSAFLRRSLIGAESRGLDAALHDFLKYGPHPNYWNEFIFLSYHHYQTEAAFLTGLPDVKGSLPHASSED